MEILKYLCRNIKLDVSYIRVCKTALAANVGISELVEVLNEKDITDLLLKLENALSKLE